MRHRNFVQSCRGSTNPRMITVEEARRAMPWSPNTEEMAALRREAREMRAAVRRRAHTRFAAGVLVGTLLAAAIHAIA